MNLEPLLHCLPTHWTLAWSDGEVGVLDRNHNICTPLAHYHVPTRQQRDIRELLVAYLAV